VAVSRLRIPEYVRGSAAGHGGSVVLNLRTGRWYAMNAMAHQLWRELRATGDIDEAARVVASRYPAALADRIRVDAEELVAMLADRRLVVLGEVAEFVMSEVSGRPQAAMTPVIAGEIAVRDRFRRRARLAFPIGLVLLRLPFRWTVWTVSVVRRSCRVDASVLETAEMLAAIEALTRRYPGRVACLESSIVGVLVAALCRRRLDWVMGVADDPYRFHAWVEASGVAVLPSAEPDFGEFRRVLSL
jgi:hypothetical protein